MKKNILKFTLVAAIAVAASWNISQGEVKLSDVASNNVEALASGEGTSCSGGCSDIGWGGRQIVRCNCTTTGYFSSCNRWGC